MDPTWLDRAISWMSPQRGFRRARARRLTQSLSYEGARTGRRTEGWVTTSSSSDVEINAARDSLRNRARDLVRNNPYAARALDVKVANTIGTGIVAEVNNRRLSGLWDSFVNECDADGQLDFYGLQSLMERVRSESGEVLVRFFAADSRTSAPVQIRVMEPDYIDSARNGEIGGNDIRYGIEYDASQRIVAYWLHEAHPGESSTLTRIRRGVQSVRVPAEDIIHLFRTQRAGQSRGVTDFAPVMLRMRDLDDYDDAEVMRKKIEACMSAFVTQPQGAEGASVGPITTDTTGRVDALYPGMIEYMKPGESITFSDPKSSGGYADFQRFGLRSIAAGYGVPYELMTGDLSQVNYSSYRAGLVDFRRRVEQDQWQLYVPRVCDRVFQRFSDEVRGIAPGLGARTEPEWTPPRFELIDPLKETQADLEGVLSGFDTWDDVVRRRGWTAEEQLDKIENWQKSLAERGIVLKSDASQSSRVDSRADPVDSEPEDQAAA